MIIVLLAGLFAVTAIAIAVYAINKTVRGTMSQSLDKKLSLWFHGCFVASCLLILLGLILA